MNNNGMDERQQLINTRAVAAGGVFLFICVCVAMIWRIATSEELGWEFWAVIGTSLVIFFTTRALGDVEVPKSLSDKPLPTGNSREDRTARKVDYALRSLLFAGFCTVADILLLSFGEEEMADYELAELLFPQLDKTMTIVVTAVISFVIGFAISWLVEYLAGEHTVKRYNKMLAELDGEDEE